MFDHISGYLHCEFHNKVTVFLKFYKCYELLEKFSCLQWFNSLFQEFVISWGIFNFRLNFFEPKEFRNVQNEYVLNYSSKSHMGLKLKKQFEWKFKISSILNRMATNRIKESKNNKIFQKLSQILVQLLANKQIH